MKMLLKSRKPSKKNMDMYAKMLRKSIKNLIKKKKVKMASITYAINSKSMFISHQMDQSQSRLMLDTKDF